MKRERATQFIDFFLATCLLFLLIPAKGFTSASPSSAAGAAAVFVVSSSSSSLKSTSTMNNGSNMMKDVVVHSSSLELLEPQMKVKDVGEQTQVQVQEGDTDAEEEEEECVIPLGMESGKIPSAKITASSSYDVKNVGPQNGRVRQEINGGAWCPQPIIERGVKEYLEIDFDRLHRITQTETQGRFGNGDGQEFAESFQVEYWRKELDKWVTYQDRLGRTILEGNKNTYTSVIQQLTPPILASKIRFIPFSIHPRTICMRVEAYGCYYDGGVIHYECPQGYWKKSPDVDLRDTFYDGWTTDEHHEEEEEEVLRGGLGLLTDSLFGPDDFTSPHKMKGNMWIGWDNSTSPVKLGFQFDAVRKFESVSIHVNNYVAHGAQIFAAADIYFSLDGIKFSDFPLRWTPISSTSTNYRANPIPPLPTTTATSIQFKNDTSHLITIPLRGILANYIRMELTHSNHWLLLSEVFFDSYIYNGNITDNVLTLNYLQDGPDARSATGSNGGGSNGQGIGHGEGGNVGGTDKDHSAGTGSSSSTNTMFGLIMACLGVFFSATIISLLCLVITRRAAGGRRNTKLVGGVIGLTPKSMSIGSMGMMTGGFFGHGSGNGNGGGGCDTRNNGSAPTSLDPTINDLINSTGMLTGSAISSISGAQLSPTHFTYKSKKPKTKSCAGSLLGSKIALCDLSKSGGGGGLSSSMSTGETDDSDEYMYHELVFGVGPNESSGSKVTATAATTTTPTATRTLGKTSALTNYKRNPSSGHTGSTFSSGTSTTAAITGSGNHKVKYQRVNHASDFSNDFIGIHSDEPGTTTAFGSAFHKSYSQKSQPSTPKLGTGAGSVGAGAGGSYGSGNNNSNTVFHLQHQQHHFHPQYTKRQPFPLKPSYSLTSPPPASVVGNTTADSGNGGSIFTTTSHLQQRENPAAAIGYITNNSPILPPRNTSTTNGRPTKQQLTNNYQNKLLNGNHFYPRGYFGSSSNETSNYYAATDILNVNSASVSSSATTSASNSSSSSSAHLHHHHHQHQHPSSLLIPSQTNSSNSNSSSTESNVLNGHRFERF